MPRAAGMASFAIKPRVLKILLIFAASKPRYYWISDRQHKQIYFQTRLLLPLTITSFIQRRGCATSLDSLRRKRGQRPEAGADPLPIVRPRPANEGYDRSHGKPLHRNFAAAKI